MTSALIVAICAWIWCCIASVYATDSHAWRAAATWIVLAWITCFVWCILLAIVLSSVSW